ncbi:MAG: InlB B-repeat-containing protein [Eubacteriaceae bacterium]|jgi:uncharacterized repeat protein (TIGR02543 family)
MKKILTVCLSLMLFLGASFLPGSVHAQDELMLVNQGCDAVDLMNEVTTKGYKGIRLEGNPVITGTLNVDSDFIIQAEARSNAVLEPVNDGNNGINLNNASLTFQGSGSFTISGGNRGIYTKTNNSSITINNCNVTVEKTAAYAVYSQNSDNDFILNSGSFTVRDCGKSEGAFDWDGGSVQFLGGTADFIQSGGDTFYTSLYTQAPVTIKKCQVNVENAAVSSNKTNAVVLAGNTSSLNVGEGGKLTISLTGSNASEIRAINSAGRDVVVENGGIINIINTATVTGETFGIRNCEVTVRDGGVLDIRDVTTGIARTGNAGALIVQSKALVSISAKNEINAPVTITGGSVLLTPSTYVQNGNLIAQSDSHLNVAPLNNSEDELTLFKLAGYSDNSFTTGVPAYEYKVGDNQDGTANVWAPAVTLTFFDSPMADKAVVGDPLFVIQGQSLAFVGGSAPEAPYKDGLQFAGWFTDEGLTIPWTPDMNLNQDTEVYAKYIDTATVTYESNGGSAVASETVKIGTAFTEPSAPSKDGFTFEGWYTDPECTQVYDFSTKATVDITLYAKWTEAKTTPVNPETPASGTGTSDDAVNPLTGSTNVGLSYTFIALALITLAGVSLWNLKRKHV